MAGGHDVMKLLESAGTGQSLARDRRFQSAFKRLPAPEDALTVMEIVPGNLAGGGHVEYPEPFIELY